MIDKNIFGGELTDAPNDHYRKFFEKFPEIETLDPKEWKIPQLLGYFCKKYFETYQVKYKFKFNSSSPSKCFEVFQIKKLASMLTAKPELLKDYIDWVYRFKVIKAKRRLTSISFMTIEGVVNEYKLNILLAPKYNGNIGRSTPLPIEYIVPFKEAGFFAGTYGDLSFLYQMSDMPIELNSAFEKAKSLGLDVTVLSKVV
jgi:hypothetical protein